MPLSSAESDSLVARLSAIPYFPTDPEARSDVGLAIGELLDSGNVDQYVQRVTTSFDEWPGLRVLLDFARPSPPFDSHAAKPWESPTNCDACKNTGWRYTGADRVTRCTCQGAAA